MSLITIARPEGLGARRQGVRSRARAGHVARLDSPDDVLALLDAGAEGVVALVNDAGATFLAPIFHELTAVVCTSGTPRSHIGIVSREFQVPCVMGTSFDEGARPTGTRSRSTAPATRASSVPEREAAQDRRRGQPAHRLSRDRRRHDGERTAPRVEAHPGLRLHRRRRGRGLVPASRDDARSSTPPCPPRRSAPPGRRPGCRVNAVHLWSLANIYLPAARS